MGCLVMEWCRHGIERRHVADQMATLLCVRGGSDTLSPTFVFNVKSLIKLDA